MVEFALALPFLAIVIFGTVDLGRAWSLSNEVRAAAREGGLRAQQVPCETPEITQAVLRESDRADLQVDITRN
ncbi:MAG TPA: TadE family protein, partial [Acidimicrobiales bacterium]|nr:TadE family protein [Acidimicrobiales bacterium]